MNVQIFTDGACIPNPGYGGWAVLLRAGRHEKMISGQEGWSTNNRMELIAVIKGLEALRKPCEVEIVSDSLLVINCAKGKWKRKANLDLWGEFDEARKDHRLTFTWVKGHSGHRENELVNVEAEKQAQMALAA